MADDGNENHEHSVDHRPESEPQAWRFFIAMAAIFVLSFAMMIIIGVIVLND